ncbi:MAG: hypothetical protein M1820_003062 [Bogoriella megaspora]|nr:MAG: hypothetical protein M1820_003062 [Bogoriella megaspora]
MSQSTFDFNAKAGKVVSPAKLAHIVLLTNQLDAITKFYTTFLGGSVVHGVPGQMAFITYDDEHHRIALIQMPNVKNKDPATCGLHHIAFTFPTPHDLLLSYRQRLTHGIKPYWSVNHGPTLSVYYRDPDGNTIETQVDIFEDNAEATAMMASPEFAKNPIGADFDPEELIARFENGEKWDDIKVRPDVGERGVDSVPTAA